MSQVELGKISLISRLPDEIRPEVLEARKAILLEMDRSEGGLPVDFIVGNTARGIAAFILDAYKDITLNPEQPEQLQLLDRGRRFAAGIRAFENT